MMPLDQATALLQDFLEHTYPLIPVIHGPTTRILINDFYGRLAQGQQVLPRHAALILGIGALSAYFWQPDGGQHGQFASAAEAEHAAMVWRKRSFDILSRPHASDGDNSLENVQAWTIHAFAIHNLDGCCSYRYRSAHNCALNAARELSIHLVDSPRAEPSHDRVDRELKRRIWWYIASTDW